MSPRAKIQPDSPSFVIRRKADFTPGATPRMASVIVASPSNAIAITDMQTSSAINASLIMAMSPALTVVLASSLDRHALGGRQWCGLLLGVAGILLVTTRGDWQVLRHLRFGHGDLLLGGGAIAWACYSVVLRRHVRGLSMLQLSASSIVVCTVAMAVPAENKVLVMSI